MKQMIRSFVPLLSSCLLLSACGGNAMMNSAAYSSYYPQTAGPMVNGQPMSMMNNQMVNGQSAVTGLPQVPQAPNLNAPMPAAQPMVQPQQTAQTATQVRAAAIPPNSRPAPTLGSHLPAAAPASAKTTPAAPRAATPAPAAKAPAPAAAPAAGDYLNKARQALAGVQSLQATVSTFEKSPTGSGTAKIQFLYRAGQIKIDVLASSDSSKQGVKLAFQSGGSQVRVRASGVLSMVALNLAVNDAKLLSGRKYQVTQIELISTVNRLTQPGLKSKILGKTTFGGSEVIVLEITGANNFDQRITTEHLGLDAKTFLPRLHEMYEGTELVYSGRVEALTPNPQLAANAFDV